MSLESYFKKTPRSKAIFERACSTLAGGVGSGAKFWKPYPIYIKTAKGSRVVDVDGNEYVDYLCGVGPQILGHSSPVILEAIRRQIEEGTQHLIAIELEIELAEKIVKHVPCLDKLRFVNTGTEATMICIRAARAYAKKDKIGMFEGHYHGQHDYALISGNFAGGVPGWAGTTDNPSKIPDCAGIPQQVLDTIEIMPFNDIENTERIIKRNASNLAAVIVEPVLGMGGAIPAEKDFLKALREITEKYDILLIFDEVITGFRLALGGAQEYYGVTPDMVTFGKIPGGGLPIGMYGGRKDVMDRVVTPTGDKLVDITSKVFSSGTFSGNPLTMAAGLAMITELEKRNIYPHINGLGDIMRNGLLEIGARLNVDLQLTGVGSIFHVHFTSKPVRSRRDVLKADPAKLTEFHRRWLVKGAFIPPGHIGMVSAAHTEIEIQKTLKWSEEGLKEMKQESLL